MTLLEVLVESFTEIAVDYGFSKRSLEETEERINIGVILVGIAICFGMAYMIH